MNMLITEDFLHDNRDTMTLAQRVESRRLLDSITGEQYVPPTAASFQRLARIMETGLRRNPRVVAHV
jgi:hypothetical protein